MAFPPDSVEIRSDIPPDPPNPEGKPPKPPTATTEREPTRAEQLLHDRAYDALKALRQEKYEDAEDALLDMLDFITGWCGPRNRAFPGVHFKDAS